MRRDSRNARAVSRWLLVQAKGGGAGPAVSMPGVGGSRVAALEVLGRLLRAMRGESMRNHDEIVRSYIQALDANPSNPDLRYALGQVHLAAARQQEAVTCFQQAAAQGFEVLAR